MKVLVTGAQGQVGTDLINRGKSLGLHMIAAGHSELDIIQRHAVRTYLNSQSPDIVINAAAYTAVDKAEKECDLAYAINRDGPAHLATECAKHDIPLLHISTDYVFNGAKDGPYNEVDKPNPQGIYGKSKLEGERAVEKYLERHIILRTAWVFGATGHNFVRTILRLGRERNELRVVADQYGGPTWSGDIASALLTIVERYHKGEATPWGTYHYSGEPATTWHGFAQTIFDTAVALGMLEKPPRIKAISTEEYPTPAQRPKNSVLNCQTIQRELGIYQSNWRIGLNEVLTSWKEQ